MAEEHVYAPGSSCQNCYFFQELQKNLKEHIEKSEDMNKKIDNLEDVKVSWGHFKWIIGGLCLAFILVFGWNVVEQRNVLSKLDCLTTTVNDMKVTQAVMSKDIEHLKVSFAEHIKQDNRK